MTATQELNKWVKQHRKLQNDADRAAFYQNVLTALAKKDSESLAEGLLALKESVIARRLKAENATQDKPEVHFEVFPASEEERTFLKLLLERMNIPFRISA